MGGWVDVGVVDVVGCGGGGWVGECGGGGWMWGWWGWLDVGVVGGCCAYILVNTSSSPCM